jgi:hypothetical protein
MLGEGRLMRMIVVVLGVLVLGLLLLGCEGETRHTVATGEHGSLYGLLITPEPQSLSVDLDGSFYLDWEPGTEPPSTFEVALRKVNADGDLDPVLTTRTDLSTGHYRFNPSGYLPTRTFLLLTVTDQHTGERVRAMFLTENNYLPLTRGLEGEGQAVHVIQTR